MKKGRRARRYLEGKRVQLNLRCTPAERAAFHEAVDAFDPGQLRVIEVVLLALEAAERERARAALAGRRSCLCGREVDPADIVAGGKCACGRWLNFCYHCGHQTLDFGPGLLRPPHPHAADLWTVRCERCGRTTHGRYFQREPA